MDKAFHSRDTADVFRGQMDATVFYRQSVFDLLESGQYWLSDTPDQPWTFGWAANGQVWRLVSWARLRHRPSGREIHFATTHVDNNHPNQDKSAAVILQQTGARAATLPVLLVGDFNSRPDTTAYAALAQGFADAYPLAPGAEIVHNQPQAPSNSGNLWNGMRQTFSLGCGSWGGNATNNNITWRDLINETWVSKPLKVTKVIPSDEELFGKEIMQTVGGSELVS